MNWILDIDDGVSHEGWDGVESDFKNYKEWFVGEKKSSVWAIPHTGW